MQTLPDKSSLDLNDYPPINLGGRFILAICLISSHNMRFNKAPTIPWSHLYSRQKSTSDTSLNDSRSVISAASNKELIAIHLDDIIIMHVLREFSPFKG